MIRIALADDHKVLRHGLAQAFDNENDMQVIGEAENGHQILQMVKETSPDVVIMDIAMPELNGIEATRQISKEFPNTRIIALSMHSNKKMIHEMFRAGAKGYLLKDCEYQELIDAIRIVVDDKNYISPAITGIVVENYMINSEANSNVFAKLSDREREVLQLLAEGKTTKQIGMILHISPKTVEGHRTRIMNKLDLDSLANLTKYAIKEGITSVDLS